MSNRDDREHTMRSCLEGNIVKDGEKSKVARRYWCNIARWTNAGREAQPVSWNRWSLDDHP